MKQLGEALEKLVLAIDAGTGSARAVIFNLQGQQQGIGQAEWTHLAEEGVPHSMGFDTKNNWPLICQCIQTAMQQAGVKPQQIKAISATSMREGIVVYNADKQPIWAVANVDARAGEEVKWLHQTYPEFENEFYQASGQTFALAALPRLLWLKKHRPKLYEQAAHVNMISDWVLTQLSGEIVAEPSNIGTGGIFSLKNRQNLPGLAEKVGISGHLLPPILETGRVMGQVSALAAEQTGLLSGTPVVMGGGDVQLGAAGLGVVSLGQSAVLGGSFWQQVVNIPASTLPPKEVSIRVNPHVISGQSQAEGITFFSGLVMRWFRDAFCELEKQQAEQTGESAYAILEKMAMQVPVGAYDILPIFSDVMRYGHWIHASPAFINLSLDPKKGHKAAMFRALQENACIVSALNLQQIEAFSGIYSEEIVFAGGASQGQLWPQILADVMGKRVRIPQEKEATALGAAMAAAMGIGIFDSMETAAKQWVKWEKTIEPNLENTPKYQAIAQRWQAVYQNQLALVEQGLTEPMWKAPGL